MVLVNISCSTMTRGLQTEDIRRSLKDVRKSIYYALKSDVKRKSENGRTYFSKYHRPGEDLKISAYKHPERAQVALTILGDRRPYNVRVVYRIERLSGGKYKFDRYDNGLAAKYLKKVEEYLASRPEERDIIDDFRPY